MKEKIIAVLGGGSARGLAHIGVLQELEKHFEIKAIIGTSMGAIIGGLYASGLSPAEILVIAKDIKPKDYLTFFSLNLTGGFVNSKKMLEFFYEKVKIKKIENLKIQYAAVAFDIIGKKTVIINKGSLASAMLASCSLPLIFKPFKYKDYLFCDGGVEYPLPLDFSHIFGKTYKVVAVNVLPPISHHPEIISVDTNKYAESKRNNFMSSLQVTMYNQAFLALKSLLDFKPDYYISAYTPTLSSWDFMKVSQFYRVGMESAERHLQNEMEESPFEELNRKIEDFKKKIKALKLF